MIDLFNAIGAYAGSTKILSYSEFTGQKPKVWIGVDPGKNGGIVAQTNNEVIGKWIMPLIGDDIDITSLYKLFKHLWEHYQIAVVLEDVHSIFGSSASSNFTFGFVCGAIEAVVVSHGLKLIKVQPKKWQSELWSNSDKCYKPKKPEQKNASLDTKATSLKAAIRLYPTEDLRKSDRAKIAHDGIIDALLMAEYGRRLNL